MHTALKGQEEELSGFEDEEYSHDRRDHLGDGDDLSSSGSSYQIGDFAGSTDDLLSDEDDEFATAHIAAKRRRKRREEMAAAALDPSDDENGSDMEFTSRTRNLDDKLSDDDDEISTRKKKFSDDELEFSSRRKTDYKSKFSDEEESSTWRKKEYGLSDDDEFSSRTKRDDKKTIDDDLEFSSRREKAKFSDDDDDLLTESKRTSDRSREQSAGPREDTGTSSMSKRRRRSRMRLEDEDRNLDLKRSEEPTKVSDNEIGESKHVTSKPEDEETLVSRRSWERRDYGKYDDDLKGALAETETTGGHSDLKLNGMSDSPLHTRSNGTKASSEEPLSPSSHGDADHNPDRRPSLNEIVTDEQQQVYKASRNRRRRRQRTLEADTRMYLNPDATVNPEANGVS